MRKIIILAIMLILIVGCTKVSLEGSKIVKEAKEEVKNVVSNTSISKTIEKVTQISDVGYDTPSTIQKQIIKDTEVDSFGDVI